MVFGSTSKCNLALGLNVIWSLAQMRPVPGPKCHPAQAQMCFGFRPNYILTKALMKYDLVQGPNVIRLINNVVMCPN